MMGDLVLTEDEVNPVMSAILNNGLDVTALHNHFFWEQPRIFYMHATQQRTRCGRDSSPYDGRAAGGHLPAPLRHWAGGQARTRSPRCGGFAGQTDAGRQ